MKDNKEEPLQVCLLRVGVDTGRGRMLGPLFEDGSFEFVPIPEEPESPGPTYGHLKGPKTKKPLWTFFPKGRQEEIKRKIAHDDPEFETFTYGDAKKLKQSLRDLKQGDLLVFYAGLEGKNERGLYIIGYFEVQLAGEIKELLKTMSKEQLKKLFARNNHVKYKDKDEPKLPDELILVKGKNKPKSRLLKRAHLISKVHPVRKIYLLSDHAKKKLGNFQNTTLNAIQRSPPRWVRPENTQAAATWIRGLP